MAVTLGGEKTSATDARTPPPATFVGPVGLVARAGADRRGPASSDAPRIPGGCPAASEAEG
eukprot:11993646-Alexandrium_andersonii.AAC.1